MGEGLLSPLRGCKRLLEAFLYAPSGGATSEPSKLAIIVRFNMGVPIEEIEMDTYTCMCEDSNGIPHNVPMTELEYKLDGMCSVCADNVWAELHSKSNYEWFRITGH